MPLGQYSTAYDGETEAIRTVLGLLNLQQDEYEKAVIFCDSKAALLSAGLTGTVISAESKRLPGHNTTTEGQTQINCATVDTGTLSDCRERTCRRTSQKGCQNYTNAH